jgi:hypothetical protein
MTIAEYEPLPDTNDETNEIQFTTEEQVLMDTNAALTFNNAVLSVPLNIKPFTLTVGLEYKTFSREIMKVVYTHQNRFLGIIELLEGPMQLWYTSDGQVARDLDAEPEQDPFDVKALHRDPDTIYLLKQDGAYTSNNAFMTRDAAVKAALARGGEVVPFKEVMDD